VRPEAADLERLDGDQEVVDRRCRAGEVEHGVDGSRHPDIGAHVVGDEREPGPGKQVLDVADAAGDEVVDRNHLVTAIEQRLAEMRAEEARSPGDDGPQHGHDKI
jgi:hypothetical protein